MSVCRCPACCKRPLRSHSEEYRFYCEVKHLAKLPTREDRKRYLAGVELKRGLGERLRLIDGLQRIHLSRKAA